MVRSGGAQPIDGHEHAGMVIEWAQPTAGSIAWTRTRPTPNRNCRKPGDLHGPRAYFFFKNSRAEIWD